MKRSEIVESFYSRTAELGDCLIWTGSTRGRRGRFEFHGSTWAAQNYAWELHKQRFVPKGTIVAPTCGNELCVAIDHLVMRSGTGRFSHTVIEEFKAAVLDGRSAGSIANQFGVSYRAVVAALRTERIYGE